MDETEFETARVVETLRVNFGEKVPHELMTSQKFVQLKDIEGFDPKLTADVQTWERPEKLPYGVSPRGAELYVASWLRWMNFASVKVTPPRRDGGYDVETDEYVVQVKNWNRDWVSVSTIREIFGVAQLLGKKAMVFSRGYLSEDAAKFAVEAEIPVFLFTAEDALLTAGNSHAEGLLVLQLAKKWWTLLCLKSMSNNHVAMIQVEALLGATLGLRAHFDPTFVTALDEVVSSLQKLKDDHLAGDLEVQCRSVLGLEISDLRSKVLETLRRSDNIRAVYELVGEFYDEHYRAITIGLSKVYENAAD